MYRFKKTFELRYTDLDPYDNIKPSSLLSFLQEASCLSADELGFGYDNIAPLNMGFIVVNWYIELFRPVRFGDKLEVHTWPLRPKHLIFLRDFELYCGKEKVGVCSARWCMIDTENYALLPATAFFKDESSFDGYNTERSIDFKAWKIPQIEGGKVCHSRQIKLSDYDHYFHVNNTKYADFMYDVFGVEELKGKYLKKIQVTYVKQCKLGETLDFYRMDNGNTVTVEGRVDGDLRVQFKVETDEL